MEAFIPPRYHATMQAVLQNLTTGDLTSLPKVNEWCKTLHGLLTASVSAGEGSVHLVVNFVRTLMEEISAVHAGFVDLIALLCNIHFLDTKQRKHFCHRLSCR
jgi:hypothetical protein